MFKFIHAADIHLDSPLLGLAQYEGAPVDAIRGATRHALENLVHVALSEPVDFVLIAGDVYDGDWKDHNTGLFFARQMGRLRDANIPVALIAGNHDAQSVMTKRLRLPENVHMFPTRKAGTLHLEALGVAVHGQGFSGKAVTTDLAAGYPAPVPGAYNIGLLHTSLTGYEGHATYAPCTADGLAQRGYDYWALGHVHQQLCIRASDPAIWFSGNIQGRHIRETDKKGCLLVAVDDRGDHDVDFRELDVLRWEVITIDAADCTGLQDCVDAFGARLRDALERCDDRLLAVRVIVTGATAAHGALVAESLQLVQEIRNCANIEGGDQVWVEKVKVRTHPVSTPDSAAIEGGPLAELGRVVTAMQADPAAQAEIARLLEPLYAKLPRELSAGEGGFAPADADRIAAWLEDGEALVRAYWQAGERGG